MAKAKTAAELEELMDLRVRARYLQEGRITPEQVQAFLDGIEDCESNAEYVALPDIEPSEGRATKGTSDSDDAQDELLTEHI